MAAPTTQPAAGRAERAAHPGVSGWRRLLAGTAGTAIAAFLVVGLLLRDPEAAAYAGGFALGLGLLRVKRGRLGEVMLALLNLNVLTWMVLGAVSNIRDGQGLGAVAIPALLVALSLTGTVAAAGALVTRRDPLPRRRPPMAVVVVAGGTLIGLLAAGALTATEGPPPAAGEITVDTSNLRFTPEAIEAAAGTITVRVTNGDLFWHTFTIDELGVDVPVAVGAERRAAFDAPPGTYPYYCRIPGHESLMRGTLTVSAGDD